ncbi:hypothetical protein PENTCL1PPCAC_17920, partial [Pristionchus entomophagus]
FTMDTGDTENIAPTSPVFAVFYPDDIKNSPRVFYQSVKDATKFANSPEGRNKGARFLRFGNVSEASRFYESGDVPVTTTMSENKPTGGDPVVAFPSVSRIEMNKLKKIVETDNLTEFLVLADLNPRFLINTSGDTAAIVQEGFRFNALHIAARHGSTLITEHILMFVSDTQYLIKLYGTSEVDVNLRKENILISYLNTPDKGNGDTPLHLASKWGHVEVARIIASYRQTIRNLKNKNNEIPFDVVCSRYNGENKERVTRQLKTILHSFYVAIYRCSDECDTRWKISSAYPHSSLGPSPSSSSNLIDSPFSPILAPFLLTAVAGPFDNEEKANEFQRKWKKQGLDRRRKDFDRGAEKVGREMASDGLVEWKESWPFHDEPIDVKSDQGKKRIAIGNGEKEDNEEDEDEYEDAQEEWNDMYQSGETVTWSEGDSLGSLYDKMQSLCMNDHSENDKVNRDEDENESLDGFVTPPSSPPPLFMDESPSKVDSDLFEVLSSLHKSNISKYPLVKRFVSSMNELDCSKRSHLPSHNSPRYWANSPRSRISK